MRRWPRARRLTSYEAASAVALAAATLPFSSPWADAPPRWVQVLGLTLLLGSLAANLITVRAVAAAMTIAYINDVLRLRLAIVAYAAAALVLFPLPPSWGWFWFTLTIVGAALGGVTLVRTARTARFRRSA